MVIGSLSEPLLVPNNDERDGYVPNVVYSCGALVPRRPPHHSLRGLRQPDEHRHRLAPRAHRSVDHVTNRLVFRPHDVDLTQSPLRRSLDAPTHVLGAFNPGLTRLPSGNLLLMVRVAEALERARLGRPRARDPLDARGLCPRPSPARQREHDRPAPVRAARRRHTGCSALTSLSWLLPVELTPDGSRGRPRSTTTARSSPRPPIRSTASRTHASARSTTSGT